VTTLARPLADTSFGGMLLTNNNKSPINAGGGGIRLNTISPRPNPETYNSNRYSTKNVNDVGGNNLQ
jgi:hypothetical protein